MTRLFLILPVLFLVSAREGSRSAEQAKEDVPAWAQEELPEWLAPYVGKRGLPEPLSQKPGPLGSSVAGLDRWQANHFIVYRKETAKFLYEAYTPFQVRYQPGTLPGYEAAVKKHLPGKASDWDKAMLLLKRALPELCRHPSIPPCGKHVRPDRNLDDQALLESGSGWCNEQARVFVRLCQVAGVPARLVFLFYADNRSGHVVAEFYADGRWSLADTSWFCVFVAQPDEGGRLLSAAEVHDPEGRAMADKTYRARFEELLKRTDAELVGQGGRSAARLRQSLQSKKDSPDRLSVFCILNYPLPRPADGPMREP